MENVPGVFVAVFVVVALVMLAVPLIAIGVGLRSRLRARQLRSTGRPTTATVVDNQMISGAGGRMHFRPVLRFRTESGTEVTSTAQAKPSSAIVGSTMAVLYDPADPSRVEPASGAAATGTAAITFGLIALAMLVAFFLLAGGMLSLFPWSEATECPAGHPVC